MFGKSRALITRKLFVSLRKAEVMRARILVGTSSFFWRARTKGGGAYPQEFSNFHDFEIYAHLPCSEWIVRLSNFWQAALVFVEE